MCCVKNCRTFVINHNSTLFPVCKVFLRIVYVLLINCLHLRHCSFKIKLKKRNKSGESIAARPEVQKLLDAVMSGSYDGVVVVELERLYKTKSDIISNFGYFVNRNFR